MKTKYIICLGNGPDDLDPDDCFEMSLDRNALTQDHARIDELIKLAAAQ